jgi:CO/xanthine dehydrogenase FAD-binding subunit
VHVFGREARAAIDDARVRLTKLLGCGESEVVFTGGGTEADNLAVFGVARAQRRKGRHLIISSIEHHAVLHPSQYLENIKAAVMTVGGLLGCLIASSALARDDPWTLPQPEGLKDRDITIGGTGEAQQERRGRRGSTMLDGGHDVIALAAMAEVQPAIGPGMEVGHVAPPGQHCHAAFSGDLAPALRVRGAELESAGRATRRRMSLAELYQEDGRAHLTLAPGELLVAVTLPAGVPPSAYAKVRVRGAVDFPLAGVAVALRVVAGELATLRVALTGTNSRPFLLAETDALVGRPLDAAALQRLDKLVQKQVQPMRTTLAQSNYRRQAAAALARRLAATLASAAEPAR